MAKHDGGWDMALGMDVVDPAGEKVGEVKHIQRHHVVVEKGWLFHTDFELPLAKVTAVDTVVHISIPKDTLQHGGWGEGPSEVRRDDGSVDDHLVDSIGLPD